VENSDLNNIKYIIQQMLLLKDINQRDLTKAELLEDRVNDIIKYFYSTNQFREGKILEILQHGVLIVKNKHNVTNDRIYKAHIILNMTLLERKITDNLIEIARNEKFNIFQEQINKINNGMNYILNILYMIFISMIIYKILYFF
jgi:hypothetical protein